MTLREAFTAESKRTLTEQDFASWFGRSKVVDSYGAPLVVFHATSCEFEPTDFYPLSHFGSAPAAQHIAFNFTLDGEDNGRTFPVFLSIKNPLEIPDLDIHDKEHYGKFLKDFKVTPMAEQPLLSSREWAYCFDYKPTHKPGVRWADDKIWVKRLVEILDSKGYDGFVYENEHEDKGSISYIPLHAKQIRPALIEPAYKTATRLLMKRG